MPNGKWKKSIEEKKSIANVVDHKRMMLKSSTGDATPTIKDRACAKLCSGL